jgi:hypothetical protein
MIVILSKKLMSLSINFIDPITIRKSGDNMIKITIVQKYGHKDFGA